MGPNQNSAKNNVSELPEVPVEHQSSSHGHSSRSLGSTSLTPGFGDEETGSIKRDKKCDKKRVKKCDKGKPSSVDSGIGDDESSSEEDSCPDAESSLPPIKERSESQSSVSSLSTINVNNIEPNLVEGPVTVLPLSIDEGYIGGQEEIVEDVPDTPRNVHSESSRDDPMEGGTQDELTEEGYVMVPMPEPVMVPMPEPVMVPMPEPVAVAQVSSEHELQAPNLPCQMNLILQFAIHRFFTFPYNWSFPISRKDLADSGFFLTHSSTSVQCVFCKLTVSDTQISENLTSVDNKHKELSQNCPFMNGTDDTNIPINDPTNYRYESHRLYSILNAPWNYPVTPYDLAKFGFYWTGSGDNCRCAFCRLEVRGWEDGDTAGGEHQRWNPNCVFMNRRSVGNVAIGQETTNSGIAHDEAGSRSLPSSFSINPFAKSELSNYGQIKYTVKNGPRAPVETLGVTPLNAARHQEYITLTSRINSFKNWPMSLPQRPETLADAGFYYTGTGDRVICFQCGGGLKDWAATDTPWSEHAKWFSRCPYLLLKKGKPYVDTVHLEHKIEMPIKELVEAAQNTVKNRETEMEVEDKAVEEQNASSGSLLCKVCGLKDIETVFLPCGHMVTCTDCVEKEDNCRTCRQPRVAYVRTFLQ